MPSSLRRRKIYPSESRRLHLGRAPGRYIIYMTLRARPTATAVIVALVALGAQTRGDDALPASSAVVRGVARVVDESSCKAVTVKQRTTCTGTCTGNSTCELVDPTDPTTGCMCKAGPAPLPPVSKTRPPSILGHLPHLLHCCVRRRPHQTGLHGLTTLAMTCTNSRSGYKTR